MLLLSLDRHYKVTWETEYEIKVTEFTWDLNCWERERHKFWCKTLFLSASFFFNNKLFADMIRLSVVAIQKISLPSNFSLNATEGLFSHVWDEMFPPVISCHISCSFISPPLLGILCVCVLLLLLLLSFGRTHRIIVGAMLRLPALKL